MPNNWSSPPHPVLFDYGGEKMRFLGLDNTPPAKAGGVD